MKLDTVLLDNKEYYVIEKIILNNNEYYILVNTLYNEDFCIRKKTIENNVEFLVGLTDELEFNNVLDEYRKKQEC